MSPTSLRRARPEVQLRTPDDVLHLQWSHGVATRGFPPEDCVWSWLWDIVSAVTTALDQEALPLNALRVQVRYRLEASGLPTRGVDGVYPSDELICQALSDPSCCLAVYPLRTWVAAS